ncbi:MAG TPA: hypothetical protein VL362_01055 [Patescibacteria group bacterium]|nr:hypothetical protein [Patescibacteria group bacterium]
MSENRTSRAQLVALNQDLSSAYRRLQGHADGRDVALLREQLRRHGAALDELVMQYNDGHSVDAEFEQLNRKAQRTIQESKEIFIFDDAQPADKADQAPEKDSSEPEDAAAPDTPQQPLEEAERTAPPEEDKQKTRRDDKAKDRPEQSKAEPTNADILAAIEESALKPDHRKVIESLSADDLKAALEGGLEFNNMIGEEDDDHSLVYFTDKEHEALSALLANSDAILAAGKVAKRVMGAKPWLDSRRAPRRERHDNQNPA